ncbi:MAG: hypothetical protein E7Z64_07320 [Thermoplasmata archaeon]|nr:hypothetical protein [Thermoplasmata archaeon]
MAALTLTYHHGKYLFRNRVVLSVTIDGSEPSELRDGESVTVDLETGRHDILLKAFHCKKRVELELTGDDSVYVTWDYISGGLTLTDGPFDRYTSDRRVWLILVPLFLTAIPLFFIQAMYTEGSVDEIALVISRTVFICTAILCLTLIFYIRSRTIVRVSD